MIRQSAPISKTQIERLKEIIKESNLTNKEFAFTVGIQPATLSRIINGKAPITTKFVRTVIDQFPSYNLDWLLCNSEVKESDGIAIIPGNNRLESAFFSLVELFGYTAKRIKNSNGVFDSIELTKGNSVITLNELDLIDLELPLLRAVGDSLSSLENKNGV